jgi:hypothetical protein
MQKVLIALDSLEGGPGSWTFGGGTALAQILGHRISYDVGIFLDSSTVLKNLAPNINPVTKSLCDTWQWPGKYLKLILRDVGEIDFLNAPSYIDNPTYQRKFGDHCCGAVCRNCDQKIDLSSIDIHGARHVRSCRDLLA